MPPLRLLHFADVHIGMENYGKLDPQTGISSRIRDFLDRLDELIAYALEQEADLAIFAGDAFKTRDPDPTQQREFARRIKKLAEQMPVFLLVGNHDVPGMAPRATSVDIFSVLEVPNVMVGRTIGSQVVPTRRGPVFLGWVPFPVRRRLLAQADHKAASVAELDRAVETIVNAALADLAQQAAQQAMPRVLVGHFSVGGAVFGKERDVMLGRDLVIQKSALADPAWDYIALGHIHKHQNITAADPGLPPAVYPGSLERIDFGEEADDKGFCWVQLERGATTWEFVKVRARPFRTLRVDARAETDPTAAVLAALAGHDLREAIVRVQVRLNVGQETALRQREIEAALAGVANMVMVNKEIERETRLGGLPATPEALTPREWVERYFQARQYSPERTAELVQAAERLVNGDE